MTQTDSPFLIRPRFDLEFLRWCWRFWRSSTPENYRKGLHAMLALTQQTFTLFDELKRANVDFEMHNEGLIFASLSEKVAEQYVEMFGEMRELGYRGKVDVLSKPMLQSLEPALSDSVVAGILAKEERHVRPETLCRGLVAHLRAHDVQVIEGAEAKRVERDERAGVWRITAGGAHLVADDVVIATGVWARDVLARLGVVLPLEAAKGYSLTAIGEGTRPRHALYLCEARIGCSPYRDCVRLAGMLELGGRDPSVNERRLDGVVRSARAYLNGWEPKDPFLAWAGLRPVTPDGLPVIGPIPSLKRAFVATGHGTLGVTLAPATGVALAALIQGDSVPTELVPFQPDRLLRATKLRHRRKRP